MKCRHCHNEDVQLFADLGFSPPSNAYLTADQLSVPELHFPLRVFACRQCRLVQTEDFAQHDELFADDYAYFSSFSPAWLRHAQAYVDAMIARFRLDNASHVVEVAANDGYLLQYVKSAGIGCLGIEPTTSTADAAREKGIDIVEEFFGVALAERLVSEGKSADLTAANNVLAHVPDINDFVAGFARLLKPQGVATFEFPHLAELVKHGQFDTIYHEHYSYLSLHAVARIFAANGLSVFDVEKLPTHGGSLRIFAQRSDLGEKPVTANVAAITAAEQAAGMDTDAYYGAMQPRIETIKNDLVAFLIEARRKGQKVGAYGAAAKGNTLLNFAGVRPDLVPYVVDLNPAKAGKFMPASHIPIVDEAYLRNDRPDLIVILPWNLKTEIKQQLGYAREWGAKFVTAVPDLQVD
ncbi:class I SAM-dependent methyltransferase [Parasphingorhabdus halotolerans]|uniref:Class I SAM-dependent methyltransferase n=1 Tax=Parasphingorhabdus halotolerans TaxID=2725558 RepID=A0A6H2DIN6_9SPHN|nr:class I SAM-dependent methyltransferase [Parasphingorhabdus halotolerans]QJB68532.1 class I SAM-dependent methyltransferase [Parasphingorhabdus halotolerans]